MTSTVPAGLVARGRGFYKPDQPYAMPHPVLHAPMPRIAQQAVVPQPVFPGLPRGTPLAHPSASSANSRSYYAAVVNGGAVVKAPQGHTHMPTYPLSHHPEVIAPVLPRQPWSPIASVPRPHLGVLIEYRGVDGKSHLGLLDGLATEGSSWFFIAGTGQRLSVTTEDVLFVWPPSFMGQMYRYDVEDIERLEQMTSNLVASYQGHLKIAWGSYLDRSVSSVTPDLLAHFLFGNSPKPHEICAAHRLLLLDSLYFEPKSADSTVRHSMLLNIATSGMHVSGGTDLLYRCRSRDEVNRIEKDRKDSQYYDAKKARFLERAKRRVAGEPPAPLTTAASDADDDFEWRPLQDRVFLERLTSYALAEGEEADERTFIEVLAPLGYGASSRDAFDLLVRLGVWNKNQNLNVFKFKGPLAFSDADLKKFSQLSIRFAASSSVGDRDARFRRDLTKIQPVFAIDNDALIGDDLEIDDGLAIEQNADGTSTVYVHIADPSRMMTLGDSLDRLARERVTSIFLPEVRYPMLPPPLSSKHFSLLPNRTNYTLSFAIRLSPEAEIVSYEITPATIAAVQCLSYEQADKLFAATESSDSRVLHLLAAFAEKRKAKRSHEGAIPGSLPNVDLSVAPDGSDLKLTKTDGESVTRSLVQEFMILVGEVTADFASRHNIALPFRSQLQRHDVTDVGLEAPQPILSSVPLDLAWLSDMLTHWHRRSLLLPPFTTAEPKPHRGLGVRSYTQATSPIRRYTDLVVHYQIKAVLRGENPPLCREKLLSLLNELEHRQQEVTRLQNHSQRYWMLRYLESQDPSRTYLALVLSVNSHQKSNNVHVVFLDIGYKTAISLDRLPQNGEVISLRVMHVDAFENDVIFLSV